MSEKTQAQVFCEEFEGLLKRFCKAKEIEVKEGIVYVTFEDGSEADMTVPMDKVQETGPVFKVPVRYNGLRNFLIQAQNAEAAEEKAHELFGAGDHGTSLGDEWESVDAVCEATEVEK